MTKCIGTHTIKKDGHRTLLFFCHMLLFSKKLCVGLYKPCTSHSSYTVHIGHTHDAPVVW